jgi:hypothetical protein
MAKETEAKMPTTSAADRYIVRSYVLRNEDKPMSYKERESILAVLAGYNDAIQLLAEWHRAPFFKTQDEWQEWRDGLEKRVRVLLVDSGRIRK